jgi:hypothetical protein
MPGDIGDGTRDEDRSTERDESEDDRHDRDVRGDGGEQVSSTPIGIARHAVSLAHGAPDVNRTRMRVRSPWGRGSCSRDRAAGQFDGRSSPSSSLPRSRVRQHGNRDGAASNFSFVDDVKSRARKRPEVTDGARCAATNSRGERCASYRAVGSDYCWNHDPELARERRVALAANLVSRESNRIRDGGAPDIQAPHASRPPSPSGSRRRRGR